MMQKVKIGSEKYRLTVVEPCNHVEGREGSGMASSPLYERFFIPLFFTFFLTLYQANAQHFNNVAEAVGVNVLTSHNNWGCGVSFYDWNKDGWPDLSFARTGQSPQFFRNDFGTFVEVNFNIPNSHEMKTIQWVDYDNDGDPDLFVTRYLAPWSLYQNDGQFEFSDVTEAVGIFQVENPRTYGASWGDIDNDGRLDLYIANYNTQFNQPGTTVTNYFFKNNADGTFTELGMELGIDNGIDFSFQAAFLDVNRDGWQDIYIINDRLMSDNTLYMNNGGGTFTDVSQSSGAGIIIDAMSITVGDYNNDGQLDIYIANTWEGNALLQNNGSGLFTDVAQSKGVTVGAWCWGAQFLDYNMDGWKDIFVPTGPISNFPSQNYFYKNNANGPFSYEFLSGFQGVNTISHASAVGDFDNDGDPDLAVSNRSPQQAALFRNNTSGKNFLKVSLEGVVSNKDGIGAFIECYAGGFTQTAYTLCGESFISQNSQYQIFGLDGIDTVDSLIIHWLGGVVDKYYQPDINTWHHYIEGGSTVVSFGLDNNQISLCVGESLVISPGDFQSYLWNTGETSSSLEISAPGVYQVVVTDSFGIQHTSPMLTVEVIGEPDYTLNLSGGICPGDTVFVSVAGFDEANAFVFWDGLPLADTIGVTVSGEYEFTFQIGSCLFQSDVIIEFPDPILFEVNTVDALCFDSATGSVSVEGLSGGTGLLNWQIEPSYPADMVPAGAYVLNVLDESGCQSSASFVIGSPPPLIVVFDFGASDPGQSNGYVLASAEGGTPPYNFQWSNGTTGPDLTEMPSGVYTLVVTDAQGCSFAGASEIPLSVPGLKKECLPIVSEDFIRFPCSDVFRSVSCFSAVGQLIMKEPVNHETVRITPAAYGPVILVFLTYDEREYRVKMYLR